jgi:hypothetical protein
LCTDLRRKLAGIVLIEIGDREKIDGWMFGSEPRAQAPDAPGTDDRDAELFLD